MTKEDAIRMLKAKLECKTRDESGAYEDCNFCYCEDCHLNDEMGTMDEQMECLQMSIEALEQQPCEDCISRADVLDLAKKGVLISNSNYQSVCKAINELPSVTPKYTDEEIDRAQAVEQAYIDKMVELRVEELKRPKGEWINILYFDRDNGEWICYRPKCPFCNEEPKEHSNYCPNCGADMRESEEV